MKQIHYFSGLLIALFIGLHLFNHLWSIMGAAEHISMMESLRSIYRHRLIEVLLLLAVVIQIISGIRLFISKRKAVASSYEKLQFWSGLYLAIFFLIHVGAVFMGRLVLHLDTNFYFGVAGLNTFPYNLFFVPYYGLAIISFFGHIAAIHHAKMIHSLLGLTPSQQTKSILVLGVILTILIFYGLTNHFASVKLPAEYGILVGK